MPLVLLWQPQHVPVFPSMLTFQMQLLKAPRLALVLLPCYQGAGQPDLTFLISSDRMAAVQAKIPELAAAGTAEPAISPEVRSHCLSRLLTLLGTCMKPPPAPRGHKRPKIAQEGGSPEDVLGDFAAILAGLLKSKVRADSFGPVVMYFALVLHIDALCSNLTADISHPAVVNETLPS